MKHRLLIFTLIFLIIFIFSESVFAGNKKCLECHNKPDLKDEKGNSVSINMKDFEKSVHGEIGLECVSCHTELANLTTPSHKTNLKKVACQQCHEGIWKEYSLCIHNSNPVNTPKAAATCVDCHGSHYTKRVKDPTSATYRTNIPQLCIKCHLNDKIEDYPDIGDMGKVKFYLDSVHYKALTLKGLTISATCVDCHGVHNIKKIKQKRTAEDKALLLSTCGRCHGGVYNDYLKSIHGKAFKKGNIDVPVCTDCHGEHTIKSHLEPDSSTYATNIGGTCSRCHDNALINQKYGLPMYRLKTFAGTYHGVASKLGDITVANCASCHGYHDILPSSDPESSISPNNIGKTCSKCHPGAADTFIKEKIHEAKPQQMHIVPKTVKFLYELLITGVMSGFIFYIILDIIGNHRRKVKSEK